MRIRRALLSVSEKIGIVELGRGLVELGVRLLSTGGTARALEAAGVPVTPVEEVTGWGEMLGGRVKTLHPAVHAAILARREVASDLEELRRAGVEPVDLVAVNLYPFLEAPSLEQIDIGGPALLRAAAKNWPSVIVLSDPAQYGPVLEALRSAGDLAPGERRRLAAAAFRHVAVYDAAVAGWLEPPAAEELPAELPFGLRKRADLRYGENPHQRAALYVEARPRGATAGKAAPGGEPGDAAAARPAPSLAEAEPLQGKPLSYNNLQDAQAAWRLVREFDGSGRPAAAAIKHATPCGVALGGTPAEAFARARDADPVSIFGGVVALNRAVDAATADALAGIFLEVVVAPGFEPAALERLRRKRNLRLIALDPAGPVTAPFELRPIAGGALLQEADLAPVEPAAWRLAAGRPLPDGSPLLADLEFAWRVVRHARSNAIVVAREGRTLGIGAGQVNRIDAALQALERAGEAARGAVLASDGFFPFGDVAQAAARAGIAAIVEPGGSIRDEESIRACEEAGITLYFTGVRHFRH
ncbi:MAG: bifunctional phosphoribosylaminoimidazolecarboxamide formyltransferase/inosine monophosphate cyclohydrolase [Bacillota bacterium]|nr:bifunctional phosphoribosylaminoimidazolecarboxamide formyltransferase/inosine monophosphate cyclohydrolase [Bacillota bacterium]